MIQFGFGERFFMRICFLGSPAEVLPILSGLINKANLVAVVSQPAKPFGRGKILTDPPVAEFAKHNNIKLLQPPSAKSQDFLQELKFLDIDLCVTAAYGQILSDEFLAIPRRGTINIHPSLLPKYRGATPVPTALLNDDAETGITILFTVKKLDAGNIIFQENFLLNGRETAGELTPVLFKQSVPLVLTAIEKLKAEPKFTGIPQDESLCSHSKKISKLNGQIDWTQSAKQIYSHYRAYTPWPGIFSFSEDNKRMLFGALELSPRNLSMPPGFTIIQDKKIFVSCGQGSLEILQIQPEGKKMIATQDYLNSVKSIQFKNLKV